MITVRKVKLIVNSEDSEEINRTYKFIRDSMYAQYQGLNRCMAYLLSGYYANGMDIKSIFLIERALGWQRGINELWFD